MKTVEWGFSLPVVTMEMVADLPMLLDQIMDSCHSLVLSCRHEALVTSEPPQTNYDSSILCLVTPVKVCVWLSVLLVLGNADKSKTPACCLDPENVEPQSSMGTAVSTAESDRCGFCNVPALCWWSLNITLLLVGKTVSNQILTYSSLSQYNQNFNMTESRRFDLKQNLEV